MRTRVLIYEAVQIVTLSMNHPEIFGIQRHGRFCRQELAVCAALQSSCSPFWLHCRLVPRVFTRAGGGRPALCVSSLLGQKLLLILEYWLYAHRACNPWYSSTQVLQYLYK
jgi:hypothetical protein